MVDHNLDLTAEQRLAQHDAMLRLLHTQLIDT